MILNEDKKLLAIVTIDRCIDIFDTHIENAKEIDDEKKIEVWSNAKESYTNLRLKIREGKDLERKDMVLLMSGIETIVAILMKDRDNISETIRELDNWSNSIIQENF